MGWWAVSHADRLGAQATTSQRLTVLGAAPTFNDNRVAIAPARKSAPKETAHHG
jgi:hypothetical protein